MLFTAGEVTYLRTQSLGRLATIGGTGYPHCVPVRFTYNADWDTIDITGRGLGSSRKYRDVRANGRVAFVVDDITPDSPPAFRGLEIRGEAEALPPAGGTGVDLIRIHPIRIIAWGIDSGWESGAVGRTVGGTLADRGARR
ncbi:pyridoxamine 5'-phosphate oxidase family protein [Micromonospora matsumotoense]|uniref:Pyridoxamine 5'-phosphate oxidase family protein n=1 Tax=Micromonospora matsumotoense TaxID=121616 RepID=A0A1C5A2C2_9ACTN|nr:PPOX class F420-dependent oxidoreductase [Micromonospora matsumotoense]SCF39241.1 pyridoxamine 5'-phosphate oxidase family protein [Micromonospora matsumotoense]